MNKLRGYICKLPENVVLHFARGKASAATGQLCLTHRYRNYSQRSKGKNVIASHFLTFHRSPCPAIYTDLNVTLFLVRNLIIVPRQASSTKSYTASLNYSQTTERERERDVDKKRILLPKCKGGSSGQEAAH